MIVETIYTTWARKDKHWVNEMLDGWRDTGEPYLCFPWIKFQVHTLPVPPFWMYLYYAVGLTDISSLQGRVEYKVRVVSWQPNIPYRDGNIHIVRENEDGKVWFLCDRFEEVVKEGGELLSLSDFNHAYGKNLVSTIRNSIPQVVLDSSTKVLQHYP
jgi:hypothetical protein